MIGGLTSDRAIKLVRGLKDLNIVGMDVVEVAPAYDQSEITALAAATLALEMLYIRAAKRRISLTPGLLLRDACAAATCLLPAG